MLPLTPVGVEALAHRLTLTMDSENWPAYTKTRAEALECPWRAAAVIDGLVSTLVLVLDHHEPGWQAENCERLMLLLDRLDYNTA